MSAEHRGEYTRTATKQRRYFRNLAAAIERGEQLETPLDRALCAGVLRAWADQIPTRPQGKRGQAPQYSAEAMILDFALLVNVHGISRTAARHRLVELYGVSEPAIRRAINRFGVDAALALLPRNPRLGT